MNSSFRTPRRPYGAGRDRIRLDSMTRIVGTHVHSATPTTRPHRIDVPPSAHPMAGRKRTSPVTKDVWPSHLGITLRVGRRTATPAPRLRLRLRLRRPLLRPRHQ